MYFLIKNSRETDNKYIKIFGMYTINSMGYRKCPERVTVTEYNLLITQN